MKTLSKVLLTGAASLGAIAFNTMTASSASAITLIQTQTFNFGPTPTVWGDFADVLRYAPGGLVRVEIEVQSSAITDLTATATTAADAFIFSGNVGANIFVDSDTIGAVNLNVIPVGTIPNTPVVIPGNTSTVLADIGGSASLTQVFTTGLGAFEGLGTFDIDILAIGSSSLNTGGGNISTNQATEASVDLIVRYFIDDVPPPVGTPEPGTVLAILAVAGTGALARRKG